MTRKIERAVYLRIYVKRDFLNKNLSAATHTESYRKLLHACMHVRYGTERVYRRADAYRSQKKIYFDRHTMTWNIYFLAIN